LAVVNNLLKDKNLENYIESELNGEAVLDLYTWLQYIPVGVEKGKVLKKTKKNLM
jgi:hypothetical protein